MTTYTAAQGRAITLPVEWLAYPGGPPSTVTNVTIEIVPATGGAAVVGPTTIGVTHVATGLDSYRWQVPPAQAAGDYYVIWRGTDAEGDAVTATDIVTVVVQATPEPGVYVDLVTFKADRRTAKVDDDALMQRRLVVASRQIDGKCDPDGGRRFWLDDTVSARTFAAHGRVLRDPDGDRLFVDDIGSSVGLVVEVGSGSSWTAITDYETEPSNAIARGRAITTLWRSPGGWCYASGHRVRVTARWGWPAVPEAIAEATLLQANRLLKRRDSPEGVIGSADWGSARVSRWDPDVEDLLTPYIL